MAATTAGDVRSSLAVGLVVVLLLAACGGDTASTGGSGGDEAASYGSDATTSVTPPAATTSPGATPVPTTSRARPTTPSPPTTVAGVRDLDPAAHRSVVERDGFRLHLGVGDRPDARYPAGGPVALSLVVENVGGAARQYDTNDPSMFLMGTGDGASIVWQQDRCVRGNTVGDEDPNATTPPLTLEAGEKVGFSGSYPTSERYEADRSACALPPGRYLVWGRFPWCPPGTVVDGHCRGRATYVPTMAVEIELT